MPKANTIKIGFVGVGNMGQCAHLRNYPTVEGCQVVAIAELRPNTAKRVAERYGIPKVYKDHRDMLASETLDGIVAPQPFTRHGILVPELLEAGIPIFTEKPLSSSLTSGRTIVDAVDASDTWMMIGYHKRSDPASMYAKVEVDRLKGTGELGKLTYIRSLMPAGDWVANGFIDLVREKETAELPKLESEPPDSDMDDETRTAYWTFVNYYIHQVNLLRYFLGEAYQPTYADPSGVLFAGESDSGVPVTIEMTPYRTTIDWQEHVLICFEKGWVRVDLPAPLASNRPGAVTVYRDPGNGETPQATTPQLPWVHAMRQQAMNFVAAVKGERDPMCTAHDALRDLEVARAYIRLKMGK